MNGTVALKSQAEELAQHEKTSRGQKNELKAQLRTIELAHQEHVQKIVNDNDQKYVQSGHYKYAGVFLSAPCFLYDPTLQILQMIGWHCQWLIDSSLEASWRVYRAKIVSARKNSNFRFYRRKSDKTGSGHFYEAGRFLARYNRQDASIQASRWLTAWR